MTSQERHMALALSGCTFLPGTREKRFVRDMAWKAENEPDTPLTRKQAAYLLVVFYKYRKQLQADVSHLCRTTCMNCQRKYVYDVYQTGDLGCPWCGYSHERRFDIEIVS